VGEVGARIPHHFVLKGPKGRKGKAEFKRKVKLVHDLASMRILWTTSKE
jgi:hypothetical protein